MHSFFLYIHDKKGDFKTTRNAFKQLIFSCSFIYVNSNKHWDAFDVKTGAVFWSSPIFHAFSNLTESPGAMTSSSHELSLILSCISCLGLETLYSSRDKIMFYCPFYYCNC